MKELDDAVDAVVEAASESPTFINRGDENTREKARGGLPAERDMTSDRAGAARALPTSLGGSRGLAVNVRF